MNNYIVSKEDTKTLNAIWWTLERISCGLEDTDRLEDCQEFLYEILEKLDEQENEERLRRSQ